MKREIRVLIIYTCSWIASLSVVIFFFTVWLFSYNNIEDPLKEAWTTTFTALSAFTTIGAAIIAASLFNDWRVQHNKQVQNGFALQVFDSFSLFEKSILEYSLHISHLEGLRNSYENYELTWEILYKDGYSIYIENINSKKDNLDLSFYNLMSKLKNYHIFNDNIDYFKKTQNIYFKKFIEINNCKLNTFSLREDIVEFEAKNIGYKDLLNMIDEQDIETVIQKSNASYFT